MHARNQCSSKDSALLNDWERVGRGAAAVHQKGSGRASSHDSSQYLGFTVWTAFYHLLPQSEMVPVIQVTVMHGETSQTCRAARQGARNKPG